MQGTRYSQRTARTEPAAPPAVRYVQTDAGRRIAWAAEGAGASTVVCLAGWLSHLVNDQQRGDAGRFHRALAERHRVIRYDRPGMGLADRERWDFSTDAEIATLSRVLDAAGESRVALMAHGFAGPLAITFAARHPERVSRLILIGTAARLLGGRDHPAGIEPTLIAALAQLIRADWGIAARTLADIFLPGAGPASVEEFVAYQRSAASAHAAADLFHASTGPLRDAMPLLAQLRVPTAVLHRRDDGLINVANARLLAGGIEGAELTILEGCSSDPHARGQWDVLGAVSDMMRTVVPVLTRRELEVLRMVARGMSNRHIGVSLHITEHTVARHLANIFNKLDVNSRFAAVSSAQALGLLPAASTHWPVDSRDLPQDIDDARGPGDRQHPHLVRVVGHHVGRRA